MPIVAGPKKWYYEDLYVGMRLPDVYYKVSRKDIHDWAEAYDDQNPIYWDDDFAKKTSLGRIVAPSYTAFSIRQDHFALMSWVQGGRTAHTGDIRENFHPVKIGDFLTCKATVQDKYEKRGKNYYVMHLEYINQDGIKCQDWQRIVYMPPGDMEEHELK